VRSKKASRINLARDVPAGIGNGQREPSSGEALNLFRDFPGEGMLFPFAQEALGHNSKAVHRACAKRALMKNSSLED
jgi:hypothetical protein